MIGTCQCGEVKYEVKEPYIALVFCYCTECQKLSAGIGSYSMLVPTGNFKLLTGKLADYERTSDIGLKNLAHFCPNCSNRIYHEDPEVPGVYRVKAGTLDDAKSLEPDAHVWMKSAPNWVEPPAGALVYDTQPTVEQGLKDIQERKERLAKGKE